MQKYVDREMLLGNQPLTKDGGITYWILTNEKAEMLCACETIRRPALISRAGSQPEDVSSFGIASVFTPRRNRRKGYATKMLSLLQQRLPSHAPGVVGFSVLYSDIGRQFYARMGWKPDLSTHITLSPSTTAYKNVRYCPREEIARLCEKDVEFVRQRIASKSSSTRVAVLPDYEVIEWSQTRSLYLMSNSTDITVGKFGAVYSSAAGKEGWVVYGFTPSKGQLTILRCVPQQGEELESVVELLKASQNLALEYKLTEVYIWNPSDVVLQAARKLQEVQVVTRETDTITSIAYYGEGDAEWLENDPFAWC